MVTAKKALVNTEMEWIWESMDRKTEAVDYIIIYSFFGILQIGMNVNEVCEEGIYVCFGKVPTSYTNFQLLLSIFNFKHIYFFNFPYLACNNVKHNSELYSAICTIYHCKKLSFQSPLWTVFYLPFLQIWWWSIGTKHVVKMILNKWNAVFDRMYCEMWYWLYVLRDINEVPDIYRHYTEWSKIRSQSGLQCSSF